MKLRIVREKDLEGLALEEFRARRMCRRAGWCMFASAACFAVTYGVFEFFPHPPLHLNDLFMVFFLAGIAFALYGASLGWGGFVALLELPGSFPVENRLGCLAVVYLILLVVLASVIGP